MIHSQHRAVFRLLDYLNYYIVHTRLKRQKSKIHHTRQHTKPLKTSMTAFNESDPTAVMQFLSSRVEKYDFEQVLEPQACLTISGLFQKKALDHFSTTENNASYGALRYRLKYGNYSFHHVRYQRRHSK